MFGRDKSSVYLIGVDTPFTGVNKKLCLLVEDMEYLYKVVLKQLYYLSYEEFRKESVENLLTLNIILRSNYIYEIIIKDSNKPKISVDNFLLGSTGTFLFIRSEPEY